MPFTLAPYGDDLVLTSYFGNSVQVWDPATATSLGEWFDLPVPVNAIGFGDDLVIATIGGGGKVIRQSPGGARTTFPPHPAIPLYLPSGLAATDDDLWVADWATGIVWQLVADGATLTPPRPVTFGLEGPEGLAVDRDGTLLVVEVNAQRLTRIDPVDGSHEPGRRRPPRRAAAVAELPAVLVVQRRGCGRGRHHLRDRRRGQPRLPAQAHPQVTTRE